MGKKVNLQRSRNGLTFSNGAHKYYGWVKERKIIITASSTVFISFRIHWLKWKFSKNLTNVVKSLLWKEILLFSMSVQVSKTFNWITQTIYKVHLKVWFRQIKETSWPVWAFQYKCYFVMNLTCVLFWKWLFSVLWFWTLQSLCCSLICDWKRWRKQYKIQING